MLVELQWNKPGQRNSYNTRAAYEPAFCYLQKVIWDCRYTGLSCNKSTLGFIKFCPVYSEWQQHFKVLLRPVSKQGPSQASFKPVVPDIKTGESLHMMHESLYRIICLSLFAPKLPIWNWSTGERRSPWANTRWQLLFCCIKGHTLQKRVPLQFSSVMNSFQASK